MAKRTTNGRAGKRLSATIRVSRVQGREGVSFMSPDEQRDRITRWATADGATIVSWHEELDKSGGTMERVGIQAALEEVRTGVTDGIVCAKVDRFGRNLIDGMLVVRELDRKLHRRFVAVGEGIDTADESLTVNHLVLPVLMSIAEYHLAMLTLGWEETRRRHIAAGVANRWGFGYRRNPLTRHLEPDPVEAPWVPRIFEWRATGCSYNSIADTMNADYGPTRAGKTWTHNTVRTILENPIYLGRLVSGRDRGTAAEAARWERAGKEPMLTGLEPVVNNNAHEPLITQELWDRVRAMTGTPKRAGRESYPLAGIVRCASCGGRMRGEALNLTPKSHRVAEARTIRMYRCRGRYGWGRCPAPARIPAEPLEGYVADRFARDYLTTRVATASESTTDLDAARERVNRAKAELSAYVSNPAVLAMGADDDGAEAFEAGLDMRRAAVAEARAALADLEVQHGIIGGVPRNIAAVWPLMDDDERRGMLAIAYPVIAVTRGAPNTNRVDRLVVADRVHIFADGDPDVPTNLPGKGGGDVMAPIDFPDVPDGARILGGQDGLDVAVQPGEGSGSKRHGRQPMG